MLRFNFLKLNTNIRSTLRNIKNVYMTDDKIILKKETDDFHHENLVTFDCWNLALDKLKTQYPHIDTNKIAKELPYKNWYRNTYNQNYEVDIFINKDRLFNEYPTLFEEKNQPVYTVSEFLGIIKKQNVNRKYANLISRKLMKEETRFILLKKDYMNVKLDDFCPIKLSSQGGFLFILTFCFTGSPPLSFFCFFLPSLFSVVYRDFQVRNIILNGIRELKKSA